MQRCLDLLRQDKSSEAKSSCTRAAEQSREGVILYGDFLAAEDDLAGAIQQYSKVIEGVAPGKYADTEFAALRHRAPTYFHAADYERALKDAIAVLASHPDDVEMLTLVAQTEPSAESRLKSIDRAIALQPNEGALHVIRGYVLIEISKAKEALASAEAALKLDSKDPSARSLRGFAYAAMGEYAKAEREHAAVVRAYPSEPQPKVNQAETLFVMQRFEEAIEVATAALKQRPVLFSAAQVRAAAQLAMGDGDAALKDIELSQKLQSEWSAAEAKSRAEEVIRGHQALSLEAVAGMEADQKLALGGVTRHLHAMCGNYRLPQFSTDLDTAAMNAGLIEYRDCLQRWFKMDESDIYDSLPAEVMAAGERLYEAHSAIAAAKALRCSQMPKRSKCVKDDMYARAEAATAGIYEPIDFVRKAEFERLNNEVAAYNRSVGRHNAGVDTANFFQELARALNEQ